jgi:hypothetical protein
MARARARARRQGTREGDRFMLTVTRGVISIEIQMIKIKKNKTPGVS